jgi:hypothetical protein
MMKSMRLSKSKFVLGMQCQKALYLTLHEPGLAAPVSRAQQRIFDQGHEVGVLAQTHFPGGVLIDAQYNETEKALEQTADALKNKANAIFEGTFFHGDVLVKIDILSRSSPRAAWEIIEVKSSTEVKEVHLLDAAIQYWVAKGSGLNVKSVSILTINNECEYPHFDELFTRTDVTKDVLAFQEKIPGLLKEFFSMLGKKSAPKMDIGPHCSDPYDCGFQEHCWAAKKIPEISIFDIPRLSGAKKWALYEAGKLKLQEVDIELNEIQDRMVQCSVNQRPFIDAQAVSKAIKRWEYPLAFLDFETIAFAIPRFKGQTPYQQIPFQFSCHILEKEGGELKHAEYLHEDETDPRPAVKKALASLLPKKGSIIAYNQGFEGRVLKELGLDDLAARLVDPLPVIRNHVYHPEFRGSFSIKAVAPALLGKKASYKGLEIGDGEAAQVGFLELIHPKTPAARRKVVKQALLDYCRKDTLCMVDLVGWMRKV